ncbi:hypothetical protein CTAYLR_002937 [Chrysophaeum taylorii]|uniref:Prolyl 4-hydroxylase alpha subunit Fe(2+) 2OG dioxygenase domain-containing protein n=1 Tax=Chrysophaeum taylorii TaxID=2483200 RepID=A0AAD7XMN8_9STRA|nr:hypothetical protein CTAYLR_002937 [Chrysophaeum taylorii]
MVQAAQMREEDIVSDVSNALCRWGYAVVPGFWSQARVDVLRAQAGTLDWLMAGTGAGISKIDPGDGELGKAATELRGLGVDLGIALASAESRSPFGSVRAAHERFQTKLLDADAPALVSRRKGGAHSGAPPNDSRVLSAVVYLNSANWTHGGELRISRPGHHKLKHFDVPPKAGTLVVFWAAAVKYQLRPALENCFALSVTFREPNEDDRRPLADAAVQPPLPLAVN